MFEEIHTNVHVFRSWLIPDLCSYLFQSLEQTCNFEYKQITIRGNVVTQARSTTYFGDVNFSYSGQTTYAKGWTPDLLELRNFLNEYLSSTYQHPVGLNSCLINRYASGYEYIGHHSDSGLSPHRSDSIVAVLSLGASRRFQLKFKNGQESKTTWINNGDLLVMKGNTQDISTHSILKDNGITDTRISLTFRHLA